MSLPEWASLTLSHTQTHKGRKTDKSKAKERAKTCTVHCCCCFLYYYIGFVSLLMRRIYFLLWRKLRRPFLSESYGHTSYTHIHTHLWTTSLRYQLWLWTEHMFAQRERERERKSQQFNVKETNRTHTLSLFLPLTIRAADSLKVLLASSCVGVHVCVGCLINRPQAFPICLYCIIAWGRFIYFINTAKQLTSFSLSLEFICVAWQVCRVAEGERGWGCEVDILFWAAQCESLCQIAP